MNTKGSGSGQRPKTTEQHKQDGTYEQGKHGDRLDACVDVTDPIMPLSLSKDEEWLWNLIVNNLPAGAKSVLDSASLTILCRLWRSWRECSDAKDGFLIGSKEWISVTTKEVQLAGEFNRAAGKFGLSPQSRCSIQVAKAAAEQKASGLSALRDLQSQFVTSN